MYQKNVSNFAPTCVEFTAANMLNRCMTTVLPSVQIEASNKLIQRAARRFIAA